MNIDPRFFAFTSWSFFGLEESILGMFELIFESSALQGSPFWDNSASGFLFANPSHLLRLFLPAEGNLSQAGQERPTATGNFCTARSPSEGCWYWGGCWGATLAVGAQGALVLGIWAKSLAFSKQHV